MDLQKQEKIFNKISDLSLKIDSLKGFVQNDFQKLIDDEAIQMSSNDLDRGMEDFQRQMSFIKNEIDCVSLETKEFLEDIKEKNGWKTTHE